MQKSNWILLNKFIWLFVFYFYFCSKTQAIDKLMPQMHESDFNKCRKKASFVRATEWSFQSVPCLHLSCSQFDIVANIWYERVLFYRNFGRLRHWNHRQKPFSLHTLLVSCKLSRWIWTNPIMVHACIHTHETALTVPLRFPYIGQFDSFLSLVLSSSFFLCHSIHPFDFTNSPIRLLPFSWKMMCTTHRLPFECLFVFCAVAPNDVSIFNKRFSKKKIDEITYVSVLSENNSR